MGLMIALLFPLAALLGQDVQPAQTTDLDPIPPTPYDAVVELEITADDEPLIGPISEDALRAEADADRSGATPA